MTIVSYRTNTFKLPSLEQRKLTADLILTYRIIFRYTELNVDDMDFLLKQRCFNNIALNDHNGCVLLLLKHDKQTKICSTLST